MEFLDKPNEGNNLLIFSNLDLSIPTLKSTIGKEHLRDYVVEKGTFLVLGVVGNVGDKVV